MDVTGEFRCAAQECPIRTHPDWERCLERDPLCEYVRCSIDPEDMPSFEEWAARGGMIPQPGDWSPTASLYEKREVSLIDALTQTARGWRDGYKLAETMIVHLPNRAAATCAQVDELRSAGFDVVFEDEMRSEEE